MADEFPPEFKFNGDDEQEPEAFYHEELKDLRVEKLSQRVTLLTILLPCLIAVAIYFGYRDLSGRVSRSNDTESLEVQRLAKEIENLTKNFNEKLITFSTTLATQDKDLGLTIEGRLSAIGKNIAELQKNLTSVNDELKKTDETIERLNASKVDKKSQTMAIEKIQAAITPLQAELDKLKTIGSDLKSVSNEISSLDSKLTGKIATLTANNEQNQKDYEQIQDAFTKLAGKTVDQDSLALEIFKVKKYFESQISKEVSGLNQRMDALEKEIAGMGKTSGTQKQSLKKLSQGKSAPQPVASGNILPLGETSAAPPGTILEKDLSE